MALVLFGRDFKTILFHGLLEPLDDIFGDAFFIVFARRLIHHIVNDGWNSVDSVIVFAIVVRVHVIGFMLPKFRNCQIWMLGQ